jgi:SAM-dependent methyltransferase
VDDAAYFQYLRGRSRLALAYRRHYLYPRLCRHLHGKVLDVGCGIGDLLRYLPGSVGADVNAHAIAWCQTQGLDAHKSTVEHLPFHSESFDSAMLDNVLEHLAEPRPLLAEIRRVLLPGGTLMVGVPGERGFTLDADHKIYYDQARLRETLQSAGFTTVQVIHVPCRSRWLSRLLAQYGVYGVFRAT